MVYTIPNIKSFVSRPKVVFNDILICDSKSPLTLELDSKNIYLGLHEIYPEATLLDLFELISFFNKLNIPLDKNLLASSYSFFWNETADNLYSQYIQWPEQFKNWCKNKKLHVNDLRPLCLLSQINTDLHTQVYKFINNFEGLKLSLADGKKILELFIDIYGSDPIEYSNLGQHILELKLNGEQIIKKLNKIRNPLSSKKDEKKQNFIKNTNWPQNTNVNFLRQGDQAGFNISVFISQTEQKEKHLKNFKDSLDKIDTYFKTQNLEQNI